jgi:AcrR family transcriptional regulator
MPAYGIAADIGDSLAADLDKVWHDIQPQVVRRLMIAATQEFGARGYHATTTRDIASRAGLSPAGVYVHFKSKEEVLYRISLVGHQHSLARTVASAEGVDDPFDRLRAVVSGFSAWHADYHVPARVIEYELGALSADHFAEIATLRRKIDAVFRETLEYGVGRGAFEVPDIAGAALVLTSLGIDVSRWYRDDGARTPESIGELHASLAERMFRRPSPTPPSR